MSLLFITVSSKLSSVKITTSLSVSAFLLDSDLFEDEDLELLLEDPVPLPVSLAEVISRILSKAKLTIPSALRAAL